MNVQFVSHHQLSPDAERLLRFDVDSILHLASALYVREPSIWLADPDGYENHGRIQRDSPCPRLVALSNQDTILYATDGCNSCYHRIPRQIESLSAPELAHLADATQVPLERLHHLQRLAEGH